MKRQSETDRNSSIRIMTLILIPLTLALILTLTLSGCSSRPDLSEYEDVPILIKGLEAQDFEITPGELLEMDCVSGEDTGGSDKAGTVEGYGPELDSFLSEYGKKRSDFSKIRFLAKDGYKKTIWGEMLENSEIVFSVANGDEPLRENEMPMRLLIPGAESSYWVYGVVEIEFVENEEIVSTNKEIVSTNKERRLEQ